MTYEFDKHFTIEQANALIPYIRQLFLEVRALLSPPLDSLEETGYFIGSAGSNGMDNDNGNGHKKADGNGNSDKSSPAPADYAAWSEEKRHEAAYRLLNALQTQGIVIQDVERGLIDFPSIRDGCEIFLCYELKDGSSIGYFHDIDAGYAGRQELTENNSE